MKMPLLFLLLLLSSASFSQRLSMYRTFGGAHFTMDSVQVTNRQVSEILSIDPQATAEFKMARHKATAASIIGFAGGVLIGIPVGTAIAGGEPEWLMAGGGALLIIASIPFQRSFINHAEKAVDGFNVRHPEGTARRVQWRFDGRSLTIRF
jgi:hypothetical protein